jgi:putative ABC transport system permease protein
MIAWCESLARDARHAVRRIAAAPLVAAVIVLSIAAGVGVNTVVFSWVEARLLKPFPAVRSGASFYGVEPRTDAGLYPGASWLEYTDLASSLRSFDALIASRMVPMYVGESGSVERVFGLLVSGNYFPALGLEPAAGRFIQPEEGTRARSQPIAVISYGLWQSRFDGSPAAIGSTLRVNGTNLTIVGVTPKPFQGTVMGLNFDVWIPAPLAPVIAPGSSELDDRAIRGYSLMGRLRRGVTAARAQSDLDAAMARLALAYPKSNAGIKAEVLPFWMSVRGPQRLLTQALAILQGIMLLLLAAVCGNTANLVLARASSRQREIGVRLALGARPRRIVGLLLTENVILGSCGAALGAVFAAWGTNALIVLPLMSIPLRFQTSVDGTTLTFAMLLGIVCGVAFGAPAAVQLARLDPLAALRAGTRSAGRSRLRNVLMAVQSGLALLVLIVAGLFFRSVLETRDTDPGFRRDGVLLGAYDLNGRNAGAAFVREFPARVLEALRAAPGVAGAAIAVSVPLDIHGLPSRQFIVDGHVRDDGELDQALTNTVTPGYFDVMGIAVRAGRDFADLGDTTVPPQAIVNDEFVRRYLPRSEPLGRMLQARGKRFVISGVVANSLYNAFGEPPTPIIYFSYRDNPVASGEIHLRSNGPVRHLAAEMRRAVRAVDPELPVINVRTLDAHVETNLVFRRVPARIFSVLAPLLLVLAAIGIYAVVAYSVALRTPEIGLRLAMGATARRIVGGFVGEHMAIVGAGVLLAWVLAFMAALDLGAPGTVDTRVFAAVPATLLAVAALACWIPARRAASVDPMVALRND